MMIGVAISGFVKAAAAPQQASSGRAQTGESIPELLANLAECWSRDYEGVGYWKATEKTAPRTVQELKAEKESIAYRMRFNKDIPRELVAEVDETLFKDKRTRVNDFIRQLLEAQIDFEVDRHEVLRQRGTD
ncbi:hypothetical protein FEF27_05915 [Nesterenkonia sphaerica]|uniref:Uncharacterized protein n=2 Tax=Nesterenkonia sphaerica TaxID=1804988 RepID=A0A5R9AEN0_9MICC|nr:hypothetical protein FEF27_05915 [Nesterenkonia sphaerica]